MLRRNADADPSRTRAHRLRAMDAVEERWSQIEALVAMRLESAYQRFPLNSAEVADLRQALVGDMREVLELPSDAESMPGWLQPYIETALEQGAEQGAGSLGLEEAAIAGGAAAAVARRGGTRRERIRRTALESMQATVEESSADIARIAGGADTQEQALVIGRTRAGATGATRMKVMAEDAVVRAHIAGKGAVFAEQGVERVGVVEEMRVVTAGDNRVCEECRGLARAGPYTLERAESLLPAHPRCRCTIEPER